jgi:hypothetical protein
MGSSSVFTVDEDEDTVWRSRSFFDIVQAERAWRRAFPLSRHHPFATPTNDAYCIAVSWVAQTCDEL